MTTTIILSDLHLGARNCQARHLARILRTRFDRLILNGDTVDDLNFNRFRLDHWRVLRQLRRVARERELVLIRGNHDVPAGARPGQGPSYVLARLLGTPLREQYDLRIGWRRFLILHGDRFDDSLNLTRLGDLADSIYRGVQRLSSRAARWLKHSSKHVLGVAGRVKGAAIAHASAVGYDGVIVGHTHYAEDEMLRGVHYMNTGCWVDLPCSYIHVAGRRVELRHWDTNPELPSRLVVTVPAGFSAPPSARPVAVAP